MRWISRRGSAIAITSLLCLFGAPLAAASAAAGHPAHPAAPAKSKPFKIGNADSPGNVAQEPDGSLVLAYEVSGTKLAVCKIGLGKRSCSHLTDLKPPVNADHPTFGPTPVIFVTSKNHVDVLAPSCCDTNPNGDDLLYRSTNGGTSFSAPVRVGNLGVNAAALAGNQIVFADGTTGSLQVEGIPVNPSGPPASIPTLGSKPNFSSSVGSYKGGVLVASENEGKTQDTTYVYYAAKGKNFNSPSSYKLVGTFANEGLYAMSGSALLTIQTKHGSSGEVRKFNGHSFGTKHAVPHTSGGGGPELLTVVEAPDGHLYIFIDRAGYMTYDLIQESSSTGSKWSKPLNLGNAISATYLDGAINNSGKGLVIGTQPVWGYHIG